MNKEIERKFLVNHNKWQTLDKPKGIKIRQTYLSSDYKKIIRIRTAGDKGYITIKGKLESLTRAEFEYEIPLNDANEMIDLFGTNIIEKTRYNIIYKTKLWEVDEFEGVNQGLIIAEIELSTEEEAFDNPPWIGKEVSKDMRYYNSNLQMQPFNTWK